MKAIEFINEWTDNPQEKAKRTAEFRKRYGLSQEEADANLCSLWNYLSASLTQ